MRVKIEDKCEELEECRNEVAKLSKRRIRYTRKFLQSIREFETCNELRSYFNSSISSGLDDDDFNGLIESPRTEGSVSLPSSDRSGYGPSRSLKCNSDGQFEELVYKWDGCSSWLKNKYSDLQRNNNSDNSAQESSSKWDGHLCWQKNKKCHSKCNSDPVSQRSYGDKYRLSSKNPNKDGLLGAAAFPRVSGYTEAVSAPVVQVHYQLNKCDNPYRSPSAYKVKNDGANYSLSSEKGSSSTTLSEQQNENQSVKQAAPSDEQGEAKSIDALSINVNTYAVSISSSQNVSEDLHGSSQPSLEAINKSEANIEKEITNHGTGEVNVGNSEQKHEGLILEDVSDTIEVKSEISIIPRKPIISDGNASSSTWNHPAKEHNSSHVKVEQLDSATPAASSELNLGFSLRPHFQDVKPDETAMSIQLGSFSPNRRQRDTSKPCGTEFSDLDDDFLISLLNNSGAFEMSDEDIRVRKFSLRTEINEIEDDQSDYEEVWAQILSMLRLEQELMPCPVIIPAKTADSEYKHYLPDNDNSIQIGQTTVYDASKFTFDASPVLPSKENANYPSSLDQDKEDSFKNEIRLPDEDSLITIKDLITPLSSKELRNGITWETDLLTAEAEGDETSTVLLHLSPNHKHLEKSSLQSHKSKMKREQAQLSSQINTVDPKTGQSYLPPPVCCSCSNESWRSPPAKLKDFENIDCYSVLDQPWNFPQQNQWYKGVTFPDLKNSHKFEVEVCSTYFYPPSPLQTSNQFLGRPAPDFGRHGWNNSQPTQGRFTGMNLKKPMHLLEYLDVANTSAFCISHSQDFGIVNQQTSSVAQQPTNGEGTLALLINKRAM